MSPASSPARKAAIFGCAGPTLLSEEAAFFRDVGPVGFILFKRNCETRGQVQALVDALRDASGRADAPVLIDQEGGRVARLVPPEWPAYPAAAALAALGGEAARQAVRTACRLIAADLRELGITVDCLPVLDVPVPGADAVIGDRAYGDGPGGVARLGGAACEGLIAGNVLPVLKHIPGHGRAGVDSHFALPVVTASLDALRAVDFAPFRALSAMPWAMTAHVVYAAIDAELPATLSPTVIARVIRGEIGFDGVLVSDDLSMKALSGGLAERAAAALAAGCDLVLHCNGDLAEMMAVAAAIGPPSLRAVTRLERGEAMRRRPGERFDRSAAALHLESLLAQA